METIDYHMMALSKAEDANDVVKGSGGHTVVRIGYVSKLMEEAVSLAITADRKELREKVERMKIDRHGIAPLIDDEWFKGKNKIEVSNQALESVLSILK